MASTTSTPKHKMPPEAIRPCISNILDIPNEILIKIILRLNARERVALGNSCKQFHDLVFEEKELLRNLDFSEDVDVQDVTTVSDIQQYFNSENACSQILAVNIGGTGCLQPGAMLNNSIGKAINLVDINVHGIKFLDVWQLAVFLNPLKHVQKLSFDWPQTNENWIPTCCKFLQEPFSKLRYLSVEMKYLNCAKVLIHILRLCQELRKLRLVILDSEDRTCPTYNDNWTGEHRELKNLEVMEYCGRRAKHMKERFGTLLPKNNKWADFQLNTTYEPEGFYLEIVDVCQELIDSDWIERISNATAQYRFNSGWALVPELLLKEVLRITHEDVPDEFCCLSPDDYNNRCLLKFDELKALLKNPRSEISYLWLTHPVSLGCDVHLVASALENLTELVLGGVIRGMQSPPMDSHFERRLRRRGAAPEKLNATVNLDSSFKMLVENSPRLKHFTLGSYGSEWDLDELPSISKWKCLETLRLLDVPIKDGKFLIEVGKQCENLRTLKFSNSTSYEKELLQMLRHCKNLRDFSITAMDVGTISDLFSSLGNNRKLRRVHVRTWTKKYDWTSYASPIEHLSLQCPMLITLRIECTIQYQDYEKLSSEVKRIKNDLKRPNLQIHVICKIDRNQVWNIGSIREKKACPKPFPEHPR